MQQRRRCKNFLALLFIWLTAYAAITLLYYVYRRTAQSLPTPQRFHSFNLISDYKCGCAREEDGQHANGEMGEESVPEMVLPTTTTAARRILLLTDHKSANHQILDFVNFFKVPIRVEEHSPAGHLLLELPDGSARFSLIIFEDYRIFHLLSTSQKQALSSYCTKHSIGIISFLVLLEDNNDQQQLVFTNFIAHGKRTIIQDISFVNDSSTLRIGRANCPYKLDKTEQQLNWTLFTPSSQESKPLLSATISNGNIGHPALQIGQKHIVFGARPEHFLIKIALMDAVNYLAPNIRQEDLIRNVQIDIDDVFVGSSGARFISDDVRALVKTQNHLRGGINNFSFTLGFSGYYFRHGTDLEIQGDELLTANAREFHWFPHMWRHNHAHEHSAEYLVALMAQNRIFAHNSGLPTNLRYAISPQHSGVYPVYQSLYDGWKQIWDVQVTSTEEYPHLRPASKRRGFIHSNIRVLPRQTCGLFTHTQFFHAYPDGIGHFLANIYGGDLFTTILMNKFSIFMTHQQNYANDRLGTFTFRNLVNFLRCWTNLRLHWVEPKEMAERYFQQFPTEGKLLYTNICSDKRHRRMLPANYSCDTLTLPNLVILGPQKTGTSALAMFLQLHPNISTNQPVAGSFEELQFFAGPNYAKGLDWYTDKFAHVSPPNGSSVVFEKTANYFDNPAAPEALNALLPSAKLLVILIDPVLRAYSWYQHMRAHNDSMALKYTAEEIFVGNGSGAEKLKNRSLWPGLYAQHLDRWLDTFPASQLILVDGDQLQNEPHFVLRELFSRLGLPPLNGLAHRLKYSPEKGFYCVVHQLENRNGTIQKEKDANVKTMFLSPPLRCLGSSKGRHYQPMSHRLRQHLEAHFRGPNLALKQLLRKYKFPVPKFLLSVS